MKDYTGACIYCGQIANVRGGEGLTDDETDKLATLQCNCDEAEAYQRQEQKKTYAEANIKRLFEDDSEVLTKVLLDTVQPLACHKINKVTITTENGVRATLTAKEQSIKVERTETKKSSLED